jgi:hypothetical protein
MKHIRLTTTLALSMALGLASSMAVAADGDGPERYGPERFQQTPSAATQTPLPAAIDRASAKQVLATEKASGQAQQKTVRDRNRATISPFELNVPGHREFGPISTP